MRGRRLDVHDASALHLRAHGAEAQALQGRVLLHLQAALVSGQARGGRHALTVGMEALAFLLLGERRLRGGRLVGARGKGEGEQAEQGERTDHMDLQESAVVGGPPYQTAPWLSREASFRVSRGF